MQKYSTISLFCGAGGLDMGFSNECFNIIWANDNNKDSCETYKKWSNAQIICADISKIDAADIPDAEIMLGGFPCQGFSLSGPRNLDDKRNTLYQEYVRIVNAKKPKVFVGENVKGILTMGDGKIFEIILDDFSKCGYRIISAKTAM